VRLVARIADHAARVPGGRHLGEAFGLGRVLFMAGPAQVGDVGELRHVRGGIVGVFCQRPVAGFAGHVGVLAGAARGSFGIVAEGAGVLTGEGDRPRPNGIERTRPVMTVLSETLRDDGGANSPGRAQVRPVEPGRGESGVPSPGKSGSMPPPYVVCDRHENDQTAC
jgi:hypothetical protein